jgi:sigma-E factor negative regulatory protein RseB
MPRTRASLIARALVAGSLGAGALLLSGVSLAAEDARIWVERMNQALATRNYDGVFVHQQGSRRETLRIIHRVQDGETRERLVAVDGSGREFVRNGAELVCYFPDRRVAIVERRPADTGFIGGLPGFDASADASYVIEARDRSRMQGRITRLITLTPRDEFRYGYRLWIDEKTAMPVKTQLCDSRGNVIEQITFASLALPARIEDELLQPEVATEGFKWLRHDMPGVPREQHAASRWQAQALPPGFRMSVRADQALGQRGPLSHLVFTDGLASVSVFIESQARAAVRPGAPELEAGATQLGSAAAYSIVVGSNRVTAVGEVPPATVRFIAQSLQQREAAPATPGDVPAPEAGAAGTLAIQSSAPPPRDTAARPGAQPYDTPQIPSFDRQPERNSLRSR